MQRQGKKAAKTVFFIIITLLIPAALTLNTVKIALDVEIASGNSTPYGYTVSLLLFILPIAVIGIWFLIQKQIKIQKKAVLLTIGVLFPFGIILDILFANHFFTFQNHNAVLGFTIPGVGGEIPIEEFVFYLSGFSVVLLLYVWCDEYWMAKYNVADYHVEAQKINRILHFHPSSFVVGALLITIAIVFKKGFSGEPGFPWYFIYLVAFAVIPALGLYNSAKFFINWRAFSFTFIVIVLISLLWEVTLALPYGWWGFQHVAMLGIYITAWHELPVEEILVWFSVSFTTIILYEVVKIWLASKKSFKQAFFG